MKLRFAKLLPKAGRIALVLQATCILAIPAAFRAYAAPVHRLSGHVPDVVRSLQPLGRVGSSMHLDLAIGLPLRNENALHDLLQRLYDRANPDFHHFLTPEQFTEMFGPTEADYKAAIAFAESNHLAVTATHPNRLVLDVSGTAGDIERAFSIQLNLYAHPKEKRSFFAPSMEPLVGQGVPILDIGGLDNFVIPHPMSLQISQASPYPKPNAGSGPGGTYRGNDFRAAYAPGVSLTGAGQAVALLEFDGYYPSDIASYESLTGLPSVTLQTVLLNNFKGVAGANNIEVALDIEVAIAMAPGLSKLMVYEGTQPNTVLNRMATDNQAKQLSSSWGFGINTTTENIFRQFAAQGQTMFQASGDSGAYSGGVDAPSDDLNLTIVGGTTLKTTGPNGSWVSEKAWNWGSDTGATGGGISTAYSIPTWQQGISMAGSQGSTTMRNIPDVAMIADAIAVIYNNGSSGAVGGTSAATPLWAGFMALVNQQSLAGGQTALGFLNPTLYAMGKGGSYASLFHDISAGNNTNSSSPNLFNAVSGYDLCTGWGTPKGQALINALVGSSNSAPVFLVSPLRLASANVSQSYAANFSTNASDSNPADTLTFARVTGPTWLAVGANGILSGTAAVSNIGTNTFTVRVTDSGGLSSTGTVYLTVNGAPSFPLNPFSMPTANAGQSYSATVASEVTDPNPGDTLAIRKVSGPAWLSVASSGALSGTPGQADAGTNVFVLSVTDSGGLSNSATLLLYVNAAPGFTQNPLLLPNASVGQAYSASLTNLATDPNSGDLLTFAKLSGPSWLGVVGGGVVSGKPASSDGGTNHFVVSVVDSGGLSNTAAMTVVVLPKASPIAARGSLLGNQLAISWTGGAGPFQLQIATNMAPAIWRDFGGPTTNYSLTVTRSNPAAFYRVQGQ